MTACIYLIFRFTERLMQPGMDSFSTILTCLQPYREKAECLSVKLVFSISYGRQTPLAVFFKNALSTRKNIHMLANHTHLRQIYDDFATIQERMICSLRQLHGHSEYSFVKCCEKVLIKAELVFYWS